MSIIDLLSDKSGEKQETQANYGVTVGVVTNNKDPEKLGRVKLKLLIRDSDQNETDWVRIARPCGGKEMGCYFLPEVEDEVLVAFSGGDIDRPYVLGFLWNSKDKPPETNEDGKNNIRMFKSRNGNKVVYSDEDGKESVSISTKKGNTMILEDEKETITVKDSKGSDSIMIDAQKNEITLNAAKKVTVNVGSSKIIVDGQANNITIESGGTLKIKSQQINIEAGGSLSIKSSGLLDIKSDGVLNIKGTLVKIN